MRLMPSHDISDLKTNKQKHLSPHDSVVNISIEQSHRNTHIELSTAEDCLSTRPEKHHEVPLTVCLDPDRSEVWMTCCPPGVEMNVYTCNVC